MISSLIPTPISAPGEVWRIHGSKRTLERKIQGFRNLAYSSNRAQSSRLLSPPTLFRLDSLAKVRSHGTLPRRPHLQRVPGRRHIQLFLLGAGLYDLYAGSEQQVKAALALQIIPALASTSSDLTTSGGRDVSAQVCH